MENGKWEHLLNFSLKIFRIFRIGLTSRQRERERQRVCEEGRQQRAIKICRSFVLQASRLKSFLLKLYMGSYDTLRYGRRKEEKNNLYRSLYKYLKV